MIKHHRYGTANLYESGLGDLASSTHLDIGRPIPSSWKKALDFPSFSTAHDVPTVAKMNDLVSTVFKYLEDVPLSVYVSGVPTKDMPGRFANQIKHPSSFLQFTETVKEAVAHGHAIGGFRVFLGGPSAANISTIFDQAFDAIVMRTLKQITAEQFNTRIKTLINTTKETIVAFYEYRVEKETARDAVIRFNPINQGSAVIGLASSDPRRELPMKYTYNLNMSNERAMLERPELREAVLHVYFSALWRRFSELVTNTTGDTVVSKIDSALNDGASREKYAEVHNLAKPETVVPPENTSRESGPNPVLYPAVRDPKTGKRRETIIKREPNVSYTKVSASVRGTGTGLGSMIVSANPADRRLQNAQGYYSRVGDLPQPDESWVPVDRVTPLVATSKYKAYFGIYYEHPLIRPSSSAQPYWYNNRNHFFEAAKTYAEATGDHPTLFIFVVNKFTGRAVNERELRKDHSEYGREINGAIAEIKQRFSSKVKEGKLLWPAKYKSFLGQNVTLEQKHIPENPTKDYPEGTTEKQWLAYLKWIRTEATKNLGLNFGAGRQAYVKEKGNFRFQQGMGRITAINRVRTNLEYTGARDEKGKPTEPLSLYYIEFILGHGTSTRDFYTYMIPLNVLRADEEIPPKRKVGRITKDDLTNELKKEFAGKGISLHNWDYVRADDRRGRGQIPYAFLVRAAYMRPGFQAQINKLLSQSENPKIQRTDFEYIIDGMPWDAYEMVVAMPARIAEEKFGFIEKDSYSRLLYNDPNIVNRLRRGLAGQRTKLNHFGIHPVKSDVEFTTTPFLRLERGSVDPSPSEATALVNSWWKSELGEKFTPRLEPVLDQLKNIIRVNVSEIQSTTATDKKVKIWDRFMDQAEDLEGQLKRTLTAATTDMINQTRDGEISVGTKKLDFGPSLGRSVRTYIQYVNEFVNSGNYVYTMRVPQVIKGLGLSTFTAPIGSVAGRTVNYSVKAPTEAIAKNIITLKLLRSSARNKTLGKIALHRGASGVRVIPETNAFNLAQWAASDFAVVENNDVKGVRFVLPDRPLTHAQIERTHNTGKFKRIYVLRTD